MKIYYSIIIVIFLFIISCKKEKHQVESRTQIGIDSGGFAGKVIDLITGKPVPNCQVAFWGTDERTDTFKTKTDSLGSFRLITSKVRFDANFHLSIFHPYYGFIAYKIVFIWRNWPDIHNYFVRPYSILNITLKTEKDLGEKDYFGYKFDYVTNEDDPKGYFYQYGNRVNSFDSTFSLEIIYNDSINKSGFWGSKVVYRDSILQEKKFKIYLIPAGTTNYTVTF